MKLDINHFDSLVSLVEHFNSDKLCRDFITEQRWSNSVICPFCGSTNVYTCSNGDNQFKCGDCHKRFSCLVGNNLSEHETAVAEMVHCHLSHQ